MIFGVKYLLPAVVKENEAQRELKARQMQVSGLSQAEHPH